MRSVKSLIGLAVLAILASNCNSVDFKKTRGGVPYKIFSSNNKGDSIRKDYIVKFEVIQKVRDSVLFSSYKDGMPQYLQVQPVSGPANYNDVGTNLMEILSKARKGDSIYFAQSVDSLFKQNSELQKQAPFLKRGDQIGTGIRIVEVYKSPAEANQAVMKDRLASSAKTDQEGLERFRKDTAAQAQMTKDNRIIEDYLKTNNIQTQKTTWGVYVQVLNPGQGPKPTVGQFANIRYKGTDLQGNVFDSGVFPLQIGLGGSIKGFEEGVRQLSKGGKARIFIPSMLGYGPRGSEPKIKPNQNLMFDIEVLDISDTPPSQVPTAPATTDSTRTH